MKLIRKNIRFIALVTIYVQLGVVFTSIVHNSHWHYLNLFANEFIDIKGQNNLDPFADESGFCKIFNYIQNNFSVDIVEQTNQLQLFELTSLSSSIYLNNYKLLLNYSSGLRGPPIS